MVELNASGTTRPVCLLTIYLQTQLLLLKHVSGIVRYSHLVADLLPLDVPRLLLYSIAVVRFSVGCDALRRHPASDLTRGCIIAPLLHHAEELVKVDLLVVRCVIGVRPSLAASFNRRAHLAATSMLLHCQSLRCVPWAGLLLIIKVCCSCSGIHT